jgi:hypothetical protein
VLAAEQLARAGEQQEQQLRRQQDEQQRWEQQQAPQSTPPPLSLWTPASDAGLTPASGGSTSLAAVCASQQVLCIACCPGCPTTCLPTLLTVANPPSGEVLTAMLTLRTRSAEPVSDHYSIIVIVIGCNDCDVILVVILLWVGGQEELGRVRAERDELALRFAEAEGLAEAISAELSPPDSDADEAISLAQGTAHAAAACATPQRLYHPAGSSPGSSVPMQLDASLDHAYQAMAASVSTRCLTC